MDLAAPMKTWSIRRQGHFVQSIRWSATSIHVPTCGSLAHADIISTVVKLIARRGQTGRTSQARGATRQICGLIPSESTFERLKPLLADAYGVAVRRVRVEV